MTTDELVWFIVTGVLSFIIGILLNAVRNKISHELKEDRAIANGLRCLLREQIIVICDRCLDRGWMKMHDLESLEDLYENYETLNGNGSIRKLIEETKSLGFEPTKKERQK